MVAVKYITRAGPCAGASDRRCAGGVWGGGALAWGEGGGTQYAAMRTRCRRHPPRAPPTASSAQGGALPGHCEPRLYRWHRRMADGALVLTRRNLWRRSSLGEMVAAGGGRCATAMMRHAGGRRVRAAVGRWAARNSGPARSVGMRGRLVGVRVRDLTHVAATEWAAGPALPGGATTLRPKTHLAPAARRPAPTDARSIGARPVGGRLSLSLCVSLVKTICAHTHTDTQAHVCERVCVCVRDSA